MINLSIPINNMFREQVEKCLRATFNENKMETIGYFMSKNDTCVLVLIMFYESKGKKVYRVLSCVRYSLIHNYI